MKSICLILVVAGKTILPVPGPFPGADACEVAGASVTDGRTVSSYACVPPVVFDCFANEKTRREGRAKSRE